MFLMTVYPSYSGEWRPLVDRKLGKVWETRVAHGFTCTEPFT